MKISENLILELLELTRMYATVPCNAIFSFVAMEHNRHLDFFDKNIYHGVVNARVDYGWKTRSLLIEIRNELPKGEINET